MTTRGDDLLKGKIQGYVFKFHSPLPQITCQSIYSEHCKYLAHSENLLEAHSLIMSPSVLLLASPMYICPAASRYSKPGQYMVTQPVNSCFLVDVNFSLILELLLLFILFQITFFFFISHSHAPEGKSTGRKKTEGTGKK